MAFNSVSKRMVKVAVTMKEESNVPPFLGHLNLNEENQQLINLDESLKNFIKVLCNHFKVEHPEDYGLQYVDPPSHFVSSKNSEKLKNGVLLFLVSSVQRQCERIVTNLVNGNTKEKADALLILAKLSNDPLVAEDFIKRQGMVFLISGIEEDRFEHKYLGSALIAFLEIMDHGFIAWSVLKQQFIKKIVSFINMQSQLDYTVLQTSLTILESIVLNSEENYSLLENMITLPHLLQHISNCKAEGPRQEEIQTSVLALVNALYLKSEPKKQKYFFLTLTARQYRNIITEYILSAKQVNDLGTEMRHQLYVLQQLLLNNYEDRLRSTPDLRDQNVAKVIGELRSLAFEETADVASVNKDVTIRRMELKNEFKKLGFKDDLNPAHDFMETPPGILALDNLSYFAKTHSDQYSKLVMENYYRADSHECPLGRASIELTKLLCEILNVGEPPTEQGQVFSPMMFAHDHSFEELFSICIVVFNKTWKEMKATTEDFSKVVSVIRVQISRTINELCPSLDRFQKSISELDYSKVAKIWQDELLCHEEKEMQAPPIVELTQKIKTEMIELVQQHRLNFLVDGTRFQQKSRSSKEKKYQFWRLSPNHKFLHFGSCSESSTPSIDELNDNVNIADVKDLVTGKDCPHKKENRKYLFPFSLLLEDNRSYDFDAPDEKTFHYWQDGINALLRRPMLSETTKQDMDLLVTMELKLRLLDTEGVQIPQCPPPIPPPPPNYNFSYQVI